MRAKSHDQRKGQWLVNKIRTAPENQKYMCKKEDYDKYGLEYCVNADKAFVEVMIWDMENDEFDKLMKDYND